MPPAGYKETTPRHMAGVGLVINNKDNVVHVIEAVEESPAMKAGLLPGISPLTL
jgi:C-terminal processing protease CtpA/Prc